MKLLLASFFRRSDNPRAPVEWPGHGTFKPNRRDRSYWGVEVDWCGSQTKFYPEAETAQGVQDALATADTLLDSSDQWHARLKEACIEDGYQIWREHYRDEEDADLSPDQWWDELSVFFVVFDTDGQFDFVMFGADLGGMKFEARGDLSAGFTCVTD
ncbi:MAG: DUF2262 domain-containing protein [Pseudomonadota bacterium]